DRAQVDLHHPVDDGDQDEEPWPLGSRQKPAEPEHDPALVLARNLDRREEEQDDQEEQDRDDDEGGAHKPILRASLRPYREDEAVQRLDPDVFARPQLLAAGRARLPEFAVDEHDAAAPDFADRTGD